MEKVALNLREKAIINLLSKRGALSRTEIQENLLADKKASRPTIIRDLNHLISLNYIQSEGHGKATVYALVQKNPLLREVDLDTYFEKPFYERDGKDSFDSGVFENLANLFSKQEKALWEKSKKKLEENKAKLDPSIYKRELERFTIELSWKSSQIEGNTYTLLEAESLIKENIKARGHPEEEALMILNHKRAFDLVLENPKDFQKITYEKILQLHGILTRGLVTPGVRNQRVRISGTSYTPPKEAKKLEALLRKLVKLLAEAEYPPEKALISACMVAYLQPFADGNKRTSRILSNAILKAFSYYPLSYRDVDINEYKKALILFYEQTNLYHFKKIFMEQLDFAINNYFTL